ncbi:MAG: 2-polyprenyl-3-methyl-6-methoxy-1,4-benzoquinone monooxygenase [Betaproteobacteria bacterium]|nr:2-polyprenyl-3-methyl-6-methoxy-1,4-benzoquinone monooxygenase [Betaproteobacteria bacterium]
MNAVDRLLVGIDSALRAVAGHAHSARPYPPAASLAGSASTQADEALDVPSRRLAGALMRVNHVGEVCAQALYQAQALTARSETLRRQMQQAARDETDHLAWTEQRLRELGDRPSLLNPLWYAGAFGIGLVAGRLGESASLGFVVETEQQVEQHLAGHLERLPATDHRSRAIVAQMKDDEGRHAQDALAAGATPLPLPVRGLMRAAAKVMTTTAHYV